MVTGVPLAEYIRAAGRMANRRGIVGGPSTFGLAQIGCFGIFAVRPRTRLNAVSLQSRYEIEPTGRAN
jgi:hypothetical protein